MTKSESSTKSRECKTMLTFDGVLGIITLLQAIERPLLRFFTTSVAPYGASGALHTVCGAPLKLLNVASPLTPTFSALGYAITAVPVGAMPATPERNTGAGGSLSGVVCESMATPAAATVATSACGSPRVKKMTTGTTRSVSKRRA